MLRPAHGWRPDSIRDPPLKCPSDSELASFVERGGDLIRRARIEDHIHRCDTCRRAIALAVYSVGSGNSR